MLRAQPAVAAMTGSGWLMEWLRLGSDPAAPSSQLFLLSSSPRSDFAGGSVNARQGTAAGNAVADLRHGILRDAIADDVEHGL